MGLSRGYWAIGGVSSLLLMVDFRGGPVWHLTNYWIMGRPSQGTLTFFGRPSEKKHPVWNHRAIISKTAISRIAFDNHLVVGEIDATPGNKCYRGAYSRVRPTCVERDQAEAPGFDASWLTANLSENKAQVLKTSSGRVNFYVWLFTLYPLHQLQTIFDIYNFTKLF